MRGTEDTGTQRGTPGDGRDLGSSPKTAMEGSAEMSGGGQRMGVASRCMVAPRLGELGREAGATEKSEVASNGHRWGGGGM